MSGLNTISADDLVNMHDHICDTLRIEVAYARDDNLLFGERIYKPNAQLFLYKDLADIVLEAAESLKAQGFTLVLYDGLRTADAQARMLETQRVKDNPHWLEEPRLLSPPGKGAHPRGMAIDCSLETATGELLDMGTAFDYLAEDASAHANPAHREYVALSEQIRQNRAILDNAFGQAAEKLGIPIFPLPQEWWDFRLPPLFTERFAPLNDADLPEAMRMTD